MQNAITSAKIAKKEILLIGLLVERFGYCLIWQNQLARIIVNLEICHLGFFQKKQQQKTTNTEAAAEKKHY